MPPAPSDGNRNADLLDEVGNYLAAGLGMTPDVDFFVGELPEPNIDGTTIKDGLYLIELPGPPPDMEIDTETHVVDIYASGSSTKTIKELLHRAYDILERKANYALVNWYIYLSYANSTIRDEGRGREGNKLFSVGFTLICRNLNNIS